MSNTERICRLMGEQPPNQDPGNGVHYGFIYQNDVSGDAMEDVYSNGTDLAYEAARETFEHDCRSVSNLLAEYAAHFGTLTHDGILGIVTDQCSGWLASEDAEEFAETWEGDDRVPTPEEVQSDLEHAWDIALSCTGESGPYRYEEDGYILETTDDNGIFVIKSPYYTRSRECSPCAPNAGYLTSEGSMKTYCLGPDWFDDDYSPLPYDVYSLETDALVESTHKPEGEDQ